MDFDQLSQKLGISPAKLVIISETLAEHGIQPTELDLGSVAKFMKDRGNSNAKEMTTAWIAQQAGTQARQGNSTEIKITTAAKAAKQKIVASAQPLVSSTIDDATSEVLAQIASGFYGGQGLSLPKTQGLLNALDTFGQEFASQNSQAPIDESVLMAQLKQSFVTGGNPAFLLSASSPTTSNNQA